MICSGPMPTAWPVFSALLADSRLPPDAVSGNPSRGGRGWRRLARVRPIRQIQVELPRLDREATLALLQSVFAIDPQSTPERNSHGNPRDGAPRAALAEPAGYPRELEPLAEDYAGQRPVHQGARPLRPGSRPEGFAAATGEIFCAIAWNERERSRASCWIWSPQWVHRCPRPWCRQPAISNPDLQPQGCRTVARTSAACQWGPGRERIELCHEQLRVWLWNGLDQAKRRVLAERLATAFGSDGDPAQVAALWLEAGQQQQGGQSPGGNWRARHEGPGFDRAAEHFEMALKVGCWDAREKGTCWPAGDALAYAGRGAAAAQQYLAAATQGADAALSLELHRKASGELLRSGPLR